MLVQVPKAYEFRYLVVTSLLGSNFVTLVVIILHITFVSKVTSVIITSFIMYFMLPAPTLIVL